MCSGCERIVIPDWYERSNRTWGAVLADTAGRRPDAPFLIAADARLSYAEFWSRVQAFAQGLLALGVRRGDPVALWMTNRAEWLVAQFACYLVGAPLVPVNTRLARAEVGFVLEQSEASTLIFCDRFLGQKIDAQAWLEELVPEAFRAAPGELCCARLPRLSRLIGIGTALPRAAHAFAEVEALGARGPLERLLGAALAVNPFDVANVIYTSGTTGFPKGGLSMHRNNLAAMLHWIERTDLRADDRMYLGVPLATNFGCAYVAQVSVLAGNAIVMHEAFEPGAALAAIERERVTWFPGAPTMYIMLLAHPGLERFDLSSLRAAIVGGAPCPPETVRGMRERLGFEYVIQCYGLSECAGLSTSTRIGDPLEKAAETVGVPFPSSRVRVVDPKTGVELPPGEQGEIWLGDVLPGSCVGRGYHALPEKTAETITADGWFRTGDLGAFDADGFLRITGRATDMFIVGGFNAYPAEIEAVLQEHPKVKLAQVFGVPDPRLGEVGYACIALQPGAAATESELLGFCKERLANYKVPRRVRLLPVEEFPMTASGKVRKFLLRERVLRERGSEG